MTRCARARPLAACPARVRAVRVRATQIRAAIPLVDSRISPRNPRLTDFSASERIGPCRDEAHGPRRGLRPARDRSSGGRANEPCGGREGGRERVSSREFPDQPLFVLRNRRPARPVDFRQQDWRGAVAAAAAADPDADPDSAD